MKIISAKEAKKLGLIYYYTGKPCVNGHIDKRIVSASACVTCRIQRNSKYMSRRRVSASPETKAAYKLDMKARYAESKELRSKKAKASYAENKNEILQKVKLYASKNKHKTNNRHVKRYASDKSYRLSFIMRGMLRRTLIAIKNNKESSTQDYLGYSAKDLMLHIESLFVINMNWSNYGEWHIDHIKPMSWFIREGVKDPKVINHLSNLQPLWAKDNLSKNNRFIG